MASRDQTYQQIAGQVAAQNSTAVAVVASVGIAALLAITGYSVVFEEDTPRSDVASQNRNPFPSRSFESPRQPEPPKTLGTIQGASAIWDGRRFVKPASQLQVLRPEAVSQQGFGPPSSPNGQKPDLPSPDAAQHSSSSHIQYGTVIAMSQPARIVHPNVDGPTFLNSTDDEQATDLPQFDPDDPPAASLPQLPDSPIWSSPEKASTSRMKADFDRLRGNKRQLRTPPQIASASETLPSGLLTNDDPSGSSPDEIIPSLEDELAKYAGGQMHRSLISPEHDQRLPSEDDKGPQPVTAFQKFLGNDAVCPGGSPNGPFFGNGRWGDSGFTHERRLTMYGQYQVFGLAFEEAGQRLDGVGHSATFDIDFRLTGTERLHIQFQPLGRNDEGGSFWKLNDPRTYLDNTAAMPERYWIEGELFSLFSDEINDPFTPRDWHIVAGKFPFVLHNELLLNDEILGVAINSNTNIPGTISNLNLQLFAGRDDTEPFDFRSTIAGIHASLDYQAQFYEFTYAHQWDDSGTLIDADYVGLSGTRFVGPWTFAGRAMGRFDQSGDSSGLFVAEANCIRKPKFHFMEIDHFVTYATGFHATENWQSIGGGDFDRLRSNFAVNPLVSIAQRGTQADVTGAALGVQIFRHHEDESWTPEFAFENRETGQAWSAGITIQRKLTRRMYLEFSGVRTWTNDPTLRDRTGLLLSTTWLL